MDQMFNNKNVKYGPNGNVFNNDIKTFFNSGFFGSAVMDDEDFLKILEEFDYSGEEAVKALEFAVVCMKYLMGGLL